MNLKQSVYLIALILSASLVLSAVSGGAGGGLGSPGEISSSSSSSGSSDIYFIWGSCDDTGKISFKQKPKVTPVILEREDGTNLTIAGEWEGTTFVSEEAEIVEEGKYIIHDPKNGNQSINCPGLKFSCRLVELELQQCVYDKGKITAYFTLFGVNVSPKNLLFEFETREPNRILKFQENEISPELKGIEVNHLKENQYQLSIADAPLVSSLKMSYNGCVGKYYFRSKADCIEPEPEIEKQEEERLGQPKEDFISKMINFFKKLFY